MKAPTASILQKTGKNFFAKSDKKYGKSDMFKTE